jgi:hypothetical protein
LSNAEKKKPVATFGPYKTGGGSQIEAAVWRNETEGDNGPRVFYAVSFTRSYYNGKDAAGKDRFERTTSLRQQDLPAVIYALNQAQSWIFEQRIADGQPDSEEDNF